MATLVEQIALVTGASRGIGAVVAEELARQGAYVVGTATSKEGADRITERFKGLGFKGHGVVLNVTDRQGITDVLAAITDKQGSPTLLVNNAGITRDNLFLRMKEEEWEQVIETNLSSIFHLTKACIRPMIKARFGRVVNISSVVANTGNPGQANYCAAKAGMIGFTKALAKEVAVRGITINTVAPGFIATDMTDSLNDEQRQYIMGMIPMQRMGTPKDIAHAVAFLCAPDSEYITGQTLHVNGGMFMS